MAVTISSSRLVVSLLTAFLCLTLYPEDLVLSCPVINITNPTSPIQNGANYTFDCPLCDISSLGVFSGLYLFEVNGANDLRGGSSVTITAREDVETTIRCALGHSVITFTEFSDPYVLVATRVYGVSHVVSNVSPLMGETVTFNCDVTYDPDADLNVRWKDASGAIVAVGQMLEVSANSTSLNYTCEAATGILWVSAEAPAVAWPRALPVPSLVAPPGQFFYGNTYVFECQSSPLQSASIVSYVWRLDPDTFLTHTNRLLVSIDSPSLARDLSCAITVNDVTSGFSDNHTVVPTVLSKPWLDPLLDVQYYVAGLNYTFVCVSDRANITTSYQFEFSNASIHTVVQTNPFLTLEVPGHHILNFTCSAYVINSTSQPSDPVVVYPSGISGIDAGSSDLSPLPGTNVTLTCSVTLASGFEESDVTYWWKEGNVVRANSKDLSLYVTTGMELLIGCVGTAGLGELTSNVLNVTAEALPVPTITVINKPPEESYHPGYFYTLTCNSDLENHVNSYRWYRDGSVLTDVHSKHYLVQAMSTSHQFACSILVTLEESEASPMLTISTKSIDSVQVECNGQVYKALRPVFHSTLVVTCKARTRPRVTHNPSYQWVQDGAIVGVNRELTFTAYPGFNHSLACRVSIGDDTMESPLVFITSQEFPPKPQLTLTANDELDEGGHLVYPKESYSLKCDSDTLSLNTSMSWYKDGTLFPCAMEPEIHITRFNPVVHDGIYQCHVDVFGKTTRSDSMSLTGTEPGKLCQTWRDCSGQGQGYNGVCHNQRCVCSSGFKARWNVCTANRT